MPIRKGLGRGRGKGYKNIIQKDPRVHKDSAKGRKQPQKISKRYEFMKKQERKLKITDKIRNKSFGELRKKGVYLTYQGDKDKDGVPNIHDCKPLNKNEQDFKETFEKIKEKAVPFMKKVGVKAKEAGIKAKELAEKGIEAYREYEEKKKERALKEIEHPLLKKLERQKDRVAELQKQHETEDTESEKEKLDKELDREQGQLREIQEKVTELKLEDLSDSQLRELAVKIKDDSFFADLFGGEGNRYENELIRRVKKRAKLTRREDEVNMRESAERERLKKRLKEEKKRILEDKGLFG